MNSAPCVDGLRLRVEFDGGEALLPRAVAALASAAERHVIVDARRRQIDHHHPGSDALAEVAGVLERVGHDAGRQAELAAVRDLQRLLVTGYTHRACNRSEDFLAVDPLVG